MGKIQLFQLKPEINLKSLRRLSPGAQEHMYKAYFNVVGLSKKM